MNIHSEINNHNIKTAFWRAAKVQLNGCEQSSLGDQVYSVFCYLISSACLQAYFALGS